jgi:hypothetical protein
MFYSSQRSRPFKFKGESTLWMTHFCPNRWCITSIIIHSKLKSWWHYLTILITSKNILECASQHLKTQSSFWFNLMVRWKGLDIINVHTIYNIYFSMDIGSHVYDSWNMTKQNKIEKILQCPIIFLFFHMVVVFSL